MTCRETTTNQSRVMQWYFSRSLYWTAVPSVLRQYQVRVISCVFGTKLSIIDTVRLCVKAEGARFPIQLNVMEEIFPSSVVSDFVMGPGFYKHWIPPVTDGAISPSALSFPVSNS